MVRDHADGLQLVAGEHVRFVDGEDDVAVALVGFGGECCLDLGDEVGGVEAGGLAERGGQGAGDAPDADLGVGEVDEGVAGGLAGLGGGGGGGGVARARPPRGTARSEPEQGRWPFSRANRAAFQRMTANGCPSVTEAPAAMMRRKAGSCRKWPWRMIRSAAAMSGSIPAAASRSRQARRPEEIVSAFTAVPPRPAR